MIRNKIPFILFSLVSMLSFDVFSNDPKVCFSLMKIIRGNLFVLQRVMLLMIYLLSGMIGYRQFLFLVG